MDNFSYTGNADGSVIGDLYDSYKADPESVDTGWRKFFEGFDFAQQYGGAIYEKSPQLADSQQNILNGKESNVAKLIAGYRMRAHLRSNTNPVRPRRDRIPHLDLSDFGLTDGDLDQRFAASAEIGLSNATLREVIDRLKLVYEGSIGFEYMYMRDQEALRWLQTRIETWPERKMAKEQKTRILSKLNEAVVFENFLHTKYIGQKRFSLEGGETTIPALDAIMNKAAEVGVKEVVIGMAHRGRLNVLTNILGKTYEHIFSEFEGTATPDLTMGDGDVKYHMGFSSQLETPAGTIDLKLCPNPSHLEAVNPVVEGFLRAKGDHNFAGDLSKGLPILIHGDAALAGQGVVFEVTQMANLEGFKTGGTLHFVINNQVGFTTDFDDARSSIYCTDVAKVILAPVLHVNGDDPESVVFCAELAVEFRQAFGRDIFIDMVCYRRHGHNESDEPKFTQPTLYNIINTHPNPREVYNKKLIERGDIDAALAVEMDSAFRTLLQDRLNLVKQKPLPYVYQKLERDWKGLRRSTPADFDASPETGISEAAFKQVGAALTAIPAGFTPLKQVDKLLKERAEMFADKQPLTWAAAELLAYGSILLDGNIVRITGQDVKRGTFSHRHAVIYDAQTNSAHNSLNALGAEPLRIFNSLLSEYAVLGFEFGYAMANPNALVVWEAQFGDFANGAQTMIDQFIASSESKWQRMNGIICLLPHGYEGQGPEHSNARPERFLQLAAEQNMFVTNITTPANFFHLLRRQLALPFRKPLINMAPKSLLRSPKALSAKAEFLSGTFQEVLPDAQADAKKVKKVVLCSGKIYYDLDDARKENKVSEVAIVRMEQLHPFPAKQLAKALAPYKNAALCWAQEEPENMGAWSYILQMMHKEEIELVARKPSASPATGYAKVHAAEQKEIVARALSIKKTEVTIKNKKATAEATA